MNKQALKLIALIVGFVMLIINALNLAFDWEEYHEIYAKQEVVQYETIE